MRLRASPAKTRLLALAVLVLAAAFAGFTWPHEANADPVSIDADAPIATVFKSCNIRVTDSANFKPTTGLTQADWYINNGSGFGKAYTDFPGPGGKVTTVLPGSSAGPGTYEVYVHWTGSGLAYLGASADSPTASFTVPSSCATAPPPAPAASHTPGENDSTRSARDVSAVVAVGSCLATAAIGASVFFSGGTLTPVATLIIGSFSSVCLGSLATYTGASMC